jgi:hypothetical protein
MVGMSISVTPWLSSVLFDCTVKSTVPKVLLFPSDYRACRFGERSGGDLGGTIEHLSSSRSLSACRFKTISNDSASIKGATACNESECSK